ncbi:MAG: phosphoribosylanthranilate isomerase [Lachnospiraceae bacterium]|nr:phosphoribosylanthranilate isomerase [Lachnospiraceae bacterium]
MTKVKFCGLRRPEDIEAVNELGVDYAGFVFAKKSKRFVDPETARKLKNMLDPGITAVGVFVDESPEVVAGLVNEGIIDVPQLHGSEDDAYIARLRELLNPEACGTGGMRGQIIKAFKIASEEDVRRAAKSTADMILLDSGAGSGKEFDWTLIGSVGRPFFLAGGLDADNARKAIEELEPYALDVSSGIETDGFKDKEKMTLFMKNINRK